MAPPSSETLGLLDEAVIIKVCGDYADHVWSETLCRRTLEVRTWLATQIFSQLRKESTTIEDFSQDKCDAWKESHYKGMKVLNEKLALLVKKGEAIALAYQTLRSQQQQMIIERPQFYIDPTKPKVLLDIQRKYDVAREAKHLGSTTYSYDKIQEFRSKLGRCYYNGSEHITPDISVAAEVDDLKSVKHQPEDDKVYWLHGDIAKWTSRTREGRPYGPDRDWHYENNLFQGNMKLDDLGDDDGTSAGHAAMRAEHKLRFAGFGLELNWSGSHGQAGLRLPNAELQSAYTLEMKHASNEVEHHVDEDLELSKKLDPASATNDSDSDEEYTPKKPSSAKKSEVSRGKAVSTTKKSKSNIASSSSAPITSTKKKAAPKKNSAPKKKAAPKKLQVDITKNNPAPIIDQETGEVMELEKWRNILAGAALRLNRAYVPDGPTPFSVKAQQDLDNGNVRAEAIKGLIGEGVLPKDYDD